MDTRRDFLKKAALLSGSAGLTGILPEAIQRALAINPPLGSTYLDAEHIVILMQENRSFDHCYGSLQGVRGFNDPRAITLPDKNLVWLQSNGDGETYIPFRLNIKDTKSTWMGSLPHSWRDQVDARNNGKYDQWLVAKKSGHESYAKMPLTLGYYNREDIPFYYALADAFTVCDQNFCSSLTGTTPNRLYLWTGTIREEQNKNSYANVRNENVDYDKAVRWKTFPERLEENNISWKIYQNELSVGVGIAGEEEAWLANFTDNPIEWFAQYNVKFLPAYIAFLPKKIALISSEIKVLEDTLKGSTQTDEASDRLKKKLLESQTLLATTLEEQKKYTKDNYKKLSAYEKSLHEKAFTTNRQDPFYHQLTALKYHDGATEQEVKIPKGDVLHQFRTDVKRGSLPTVSWLVAPENFSDHPGAPWYGAWYVSEVMDILTKNPEIWKKTIFILAYDENDGYFDHVPPFTVPNPSQPDTGLTSKGIPADVEFVTLEQDMKKKAEKDSRESSIGLGYRVPLVIASPWNRGGMVCSQVFDHTSVLQFLEKFLSHKRGKKIEESNISAWRRTVCGDLTSAFKPYQGEKITLPSFLSKNDFIESVHKAKFKKDPSGYRPLEKHEIEMINKDPSSFPLMPRQEKGTRTACALPYQLYVDGRLHEDKKMFSIKFQASDEIFGKKTAGSPFTVYAPGKYKANDEDLWEAVKTWSYAVMAGDTITDTWPLSAFENENYHLRVYGPNGFFREFTGNSEDAPLDISCEYERSSVKDLTGNIHVRIINTGSDSYTIEINDQAYEQPPQTVIIAPKGQATLTVDLAKSYGWYDFIVGVTGVEHFKKRYAGKVENGLEGLTDPAMGLS